mgnify:CR=1 FL=1
MNLQEINNLIPIASQWVAVQEEFILSNGVQLTEKQMQIASKIGIKNTAKIRLLKVESIPKPEDSILNEASKGIGLISFNNFWSQICRPLLSSLIFSKDSFFSHVITLTALRGGGGGH